MLDHASPTPVLYIILVYWIDERKHFVLVRLLLNSTKKISKRIFLYSLCYTRPILKEITRKIYIFKINVHKYVTIRALKKLFMQIYQTSKHFLSIASNWLDSSPIFEILRDDYGYVTCISIPEIVYLVLGWFGSFYHLITCIIQP